VRIELADVPGWSPTLLPRSMRDPWFESLAAECETQTALHFCMPHQVRRFADRFNVNYTMFEATRVPLRWVAENLKHDLVIVPSESSRLAWLKSGMPEHRLRVCPLGVDPEKFSAGLQPFPLPLDRVYRTRFLNVSENNPRKNLAALFEAWIRATTPADDAIFIAKTGRAALDLESIAQRAGKRLEDAAPIYLLDEILPDSEMPRLYAAATHYISMSCGEGWDQPMMEAAASGLRLIAPAHSAYTTYLDASVATMLPATEVPVVYTGDPATAALFEGASWWQPDREAAVKAIRAAVERRDDPRGSARERVIERFTWKQAAHRLLEILGELESLGDKRRYVAMLQAYKRGAEAPERSQPDAPAEVDPA
jgi:glycosyltransferase involved in cell wall biosynthesis